MKNWISNGPIVPIKELDRFAQFRPLSERLQMRRMGASARDTKHFSDDPGYKEQVPYVPDGGPLVKPATMLMTMPDSLVQPLFDGPLDIVGDVHGEINALRSLLHHLGYGDDGNHPANRRLVFVGDLTDRGPDSPAVVDLVEGLVKSERAQCVLGNHDLNILLGAHKHDNRWFFGEEWNLDPSGEPHPARMADTGIQRRVLGFFKSLPLALERDGLRVVHACWDDDVVNLARRADDAVALYKQHAAIISDWHDRSNLDENIRELERQNLNPVKVLSSGKERHTDNTFEAGGKPRNTERVKWWEDYSDPEICVFGHYSLSRYETDSFGNAVCVDFAVGKRWKERLSPGFDGTFRGQLAALSFPEMNLVFDDGETEPVG